jgi:NAD-dependent dihydropyrimidine dehydrogenase PreA subunit
MKVTRKIIEIDEERCDGCGNCVISCAEGALKIIDGKAKVISDNLCDGLGACIGECPQDALKIIEREAEDFDEAAVESTWRLHKEEEKKTMPCGCPSTQIQSFAPAAGCQSANTPTSFEKAASALTHWPVQIRLIPAHGPISQRRRPAGGGRLCAGGLSQPAPGFYGGQDRDAGLPQIRRCPGIRGQVRRDFQTGGVKSVTTLIMEVPCCSGLPMIVKKGMDKAGVNVPSRQVTISTRGEILKGR